MKTFYRADDYDKKGSGSFVGFYTSLSKAKSDLQCVKKTPNHPPEHTAHSQVTEFTTEAEQPSMDAWSSGTIVRTYYYI